MKICRALLTVGLGLLIASVVPLTLRQQVLCTDIEAGEPGITSVYWHSEVLDSDSGAGEVSVALDGSGYPHVSYGNGSDYLVYTRWDGSQWIDETVDYVPGCSYAASLTVDDTGDPQILYAVGNYLWDQTRFAERSGNGWLIAPAVEDHGSLATDAAGDPHTAYRPYNTGQLKYAHRVAGVWISSTVEGEDITNPSVSLALNDNEYPHISYYRENNLRYAYWTGSTWVSETVSFAADDDWIGQDTSLALDADGNPHIAYFVGTTNDLKYAERGSSGWTVQTVDSDGDVGRYASLVLDSSGSPHISYHDRDSQSINYAYWTGEQWEINEVETGVEYAPYTSLAISSNDWLHLVYRRYREAADNVLVHAWLGLESDPPGTIDDLSASVDSDPGAVRLNWTAPGDDGDVGQVAAYTVRYADYPIDTTFAWIAAADVPGEPVPQPAGSAETMSITGLSSQKAYYFAIRAEDDNGNLSDLSNSPAFAYGGYWPTVDGYRFHNGSIEAASWDVFRETFGAENVERVILGFTYRRRSAEDYFNTHYTARVGTRGNCSGMSVTGALLREGWVTPDDILDQQDVDDLYSIPAPSTVGGHWQRSNLVDFIVRYQGYQRGLQVKQAQADATDLTLLETVNVLKASLGDTSGRPQYVAVRGPNPRICSGHALLPYAYQQSGDIVRFSVYDSNDPGATDQYLEVDLQTNTWEYVHPGGSLIWGSDRGCSAILAEVDHPRLLTLPVEAWRYSPEPSWRLRGSVASQDDAQSPASMYEYSVEAGASLLIQDASGQAIGIDGDQVVEELPGAYMWIPEAIIPGEVPEYRETYVISTTGELTATLVYSEAGAVRMYGIVPGAQVEVLGVTSAGGVSDTVHIAPDGLVTHVAAGSPGAARAITVTTEDATADFVVSIAEFDLAATDTIDVNARACATGVVTLTSTSNQDGYVVRMSRTGAGVDAFVGVVPNMVGGDVHTVYLDWDDPTDATVLVDRSGDGTIDETIPVPNAAYSYIYMPLVIRR